MEFKGLQEKIRKMNVHYDAPHLDFNYWLGRYPISPYIIYVSNHFKIKYENELHVMTSSS